MYANAVELNCSLTLPAKDVNGRNASATSASDCRLQPSGTRSMKGQNLNARFEDVLERYKVKLRRTPFK